MTVTYNGPAIPVLTIEEWARIHELLLYSNRHEDVLLRNRIREWLDLVTKVTNVTGS